VRVDQQRPAVASLLVGLDAAEALRRIPALLPVCGRAQSLAARRALAAARGEARAREDDVRVDELWQEQARAAAWRLAIDWPDLLGEERDLAALRRVMQAGTAGDAAARLAEFLPGIEGIDSMADLLHWMATADCSAARTLRHADAVEEGATGGGAVSLLRGEALLRQALTVFATPGFDPLDPAGVAVEVGPLAMARDPLVAALPAVQGVGRSTRRLLAQVLDTRAVTRALAQAPEFAAAGDSLTVAPGLGVGSALTTRGPVFHRVALAPEGGNTVGEWRVLAPTDWHFARRGPLAAATAGSTPEATPLRLLVASLDPCVAWSVMAPAGAGDA
jgi:hypothetical protein